MDGQQQNFYLDNLNLDSNEISWDRAEQKTAPGTPVPEQNPNAWNTTPDRNPRALGGRVSAFPDSAFGATASPSAEAIPHAEHLQPEILAPAPIISPEPINPAIISSTTTPEADKAGISSASIPAATSILEENNNHHESAEEFARTAEIELAQDGNIAGFYEKIRNYGDTK